MPLCPLLGVSYHIATSSSQAQASERKNIQLDNIEKLGTYPHRANRRNLPQT